MARGGIYDHLGGGFSRYSIDDRWLIPHFEKMLYDNAILAETYLEAWKYTKKEKVREIAIGTLDYLMREMKAPNAHGNDAPKPEVPWFWLQGLDSCRFEFAFFFAGKTVHVQRLLEIGAQSLHKRPP